MPHPRLSKAENVMRAAGDWLLECEAAVVAESVWEEAHDVPYNRDLFHSKPPSHMQVQKLSVRIFFGSLKGY